ncbi:pectinesterase family protein [Dyadobacter psychrotolerans]|uniref:Pectinesterase n=1 Tax=Dyadobacter psychrotolerans TaxID=2541721 RepID=A0A4R5DYD4_9BACT|nr:pectinesterase family protein [Dyadobacter psychrotolerans]TDE17211.1 pectin esterase [Dyadobacter psychrotolerans]
MKEFRMLVLLVSCFIAVKATAQSKVLPTKLTVAQDGSGDYKTIQEAVNSVRDLGQKRVTIFIKKGIYKEKLIIPTWKTAISLIGEDPANTIIRHSDFSGKDVEGGHDSFGNSKFSTYTSFTVLVQGNDFIAENLTIENTAGRVGQAVALHVEADRAAFKNCRFLGNQDTLYLATEGSRQYYENCYVEGTVDFIFGEATVVFQNCTVKSLTDSYITAAATRKGHEFGFVFFNCKLIAEASATKVYLGRPWRPYAKTVFVNSELGAHILPQGWDPWVGDSMFPDKDKTALYAEYKNSGPGADVSKRIRWSKQLKDQEVKKYTVKNILGGPDGWVPLQVISGQ